MPDVQTQETTTSRLERALIYVWSRLDETSSARGLITLLAILSGWTLDPQNLINYVSGAVAFSAVMKTVLPDLWSSLRTKYPDALPPSV